MTVSEQPVCPLRLAELAIENGWPVEAVAEALAAIVGAAAKPETVEVETSASSERSVVIGEVFARASTRKG